MALDIKEDDKKYYTPQELAEYLGEMGQRGITPSFSNIESEVASGQSMQVGDVALSALDKWVSVRRDQDVGLDTESKAASEFKSTGIAEVDAWNRRALAKADAESKQQQMVLDAGGAYTDQIMDLQTKLTRTRAMFRPDSELHEIYTGQMQQYLTDTIALQEQAVKQAQFSNEYAALTAEIAEHDKYLTAHKAAMERAQQVQYAKEVTTARITATTAAAQEEAISEVSPAIAVAAHNVLNTPDTATAKEEWALRRDNIDPTKRQVIKQMARNEGNPMANTPAENIGRPLEELGVYLDTYKNTIPENDVQGKAAADILASETARLKDNLAEIQRAAISEDTTLTNMAREIEQLSKTSESVRAERGYDSKYSAYQDRLNAIGGEQLYSAMVNNLKAVMWDTNRDLLKVPHTTQTVAASTIANEIVGHLKAKEATSIMHGVNNFYREGYSKLTEAGYPPNLISQVMEEVLVNYALDTSARHAGFGIALTTADAQAIAAGSMFSRLLGGATFIPSVDTGVAP